MFIPRRGFFRVFFQGQILSLNTSDRTFLLTNDDGWDAPGLEALVEAIAGLGVASLVAPAGPYSGCAHQVTTDRPITIDAKKTNLTIVGGTPADCVRLALDHVFPNPSWILSGINRGGNLGVDVHHSGTVAAAREGSIRGIPGIALSQYVARGKAVDWANSARLARAVLTRLLATPPTPGTFWNVNLPHLDSDAPEPEIVFCGLDPAPLPVRYRLEGNLAHYVGDYQARPRTPRRDVAICFGGRISVTRISLVDLGPGEFS